MANRRFIKTGGVTKILECTHAWIYVLERTGILTPAARTESGQRLYDLAEVRRVKEERRAAREQRRQKTVGA